MGLVGTIDRTAILSWCPTQTKQTDLFVVASYGGSVDPGFDTGSVLELYSLDSQGNLNVAEHTPQGHVQKLSSTNCEEKFLKLSWGRKPNNDELGLVGGGFPSGMIKVWDVDRWSSRASNTLLFSSDRKDTKTSKGPVSALEFSPFISGLLASTGSSSEFYIWDLSVSKPVEERQVKGYSLDSSSLFRGATGTSNLASAELTTLTWNKGNQRILATGHVSGLCVIWDLSQKRSVVSFRDSDTKKRISCLSWSPVVPVQIITGSDDDRGSSLFMWDLRATKVPMKDLGAHAHGVTSVSWCSQDPNLIICCTKDGRCIILHSQTGDLLGEIPADSGWNFDVQWSNTLPGLVSVCSLESKVSIWNVVTGANDSVGDTQATTSALKDSFGEEFASGLPPEMAQGTPRDSKRSKESFPILANYAPSWMKRRSGIAFGFDGSLLRFGVSSSHSSQSPSSFVEIEQIHVNPDVVSTNRRIQEMLIEGRPQLFCMEKVRERCSWKDWRTNFGPEVYLDVWETIALWCSSNPRQELLSRLQQSMPPILLEESPGQRFMGFALCPCIYSLSDVVPKLESDSPYNELKNEINDPVHQSPTGPAPWELDKQDEMNIHSTQEDTIASDFSSLDLAKKSAQDETRKSSTRKPKFVECVLQGTLPNAVDAALSENRLSDALILASVGGIELFRNTRIRCLQLEGNPTLAFIIACVEEEGKALEILRSIELSDSKSVSSHSLLTWQEALSMILSYAPPGSSFISLCNQLGNKLQDELRNSKGSALCFLCAGNIPKLSYSWACEAKQVPHPHRRYRNWKWSNIKELLEYVERLMVLRCCISMSDSASLYSEELNVIDEEASRAFCDYATLLVAEGECQSALSYLAPLNPQTQGTFGVAGELLHRTYWKLGEHVASQLGFPESPPVPFAFVEPKRPSIQTRQQAPVSPLFTTTAPGSYMPSHGNFPVSDSTAFGSDMRNVQENRDIPRPLENTLQPNPFPSTVGPTTSFYPATSTTNRTVPPQASYSVSGQSSPYTGGHALPPSISAENVGAVAGMTPTNASSRMTAVTGSGYSQPIQAPPSFQGPTQSHSNIATNETTNIPRTQHGNYTFFDLSQQTVRLGASDTQQQTSNAAPPPPTSTTSTRTLPETSQSFFSKPYTPESRGTLSTTVSSSFSSSSVAPPPPPPPAPASTNPVNTSEYDRYRMQATNVTTSSMFTSAHHLSMSSRPTASGETTESYGNNLPPSQVNTYSLSGNVNAQVPKQLSSSNTSPTQTMSRMGVVSNATSGISPVQKQQTEQRGVASLSTSMPLNNSASSQRDVNEPVANVPLQSSVSVTSPSGQDGTKVQSASLTTLTAADISQVSSNYKIVVDTLRAFYSHCLTLNQQPIYKRKLDDVNRKLGQLVTKLNSGQVNEEIGNKLIELCKMLGQGNYEGASKLQVALTQQHWEGNSSWIIALKRLIEAGKTGS